MSAARSSRRLRQAPPTPAPTIRLTLLHDLPALDGEPRAGLLLPLAPNATGRRQALRIYPNLAAAVAAKRQLEGRAR